MTQLLESLLEESFETILRAQNCVPRSIQFATSPNIIKVAIGMRRSGKTYFLYQIINQLIEKGINKEQILFVNLEDDRLLPMTAKELGVLLDKFYSLYPDNHKRCCYFFLDEIQNIENWEQVVRRFHDSKNIQLYLTGSSAKLLSKEISTSLRGRSLATEVWPYNFQEFMLAQNISPEKKPFGKQSFDIMRKHLLKFFSIGGFPAVQKIPQNEWRETIQNYIDTVILRDIIERHDIKNTKPLKYLATTLIKNSAAIFSVNKFYNDIKSQGYKISKDSIYNYLDYIEDAFLAFSVPLYSESFRALQTAPRKIYTTDNGLINACSLGTNDLYNKLFENQVYLDLRRQNKKIYYYHTKNGYEIDFVTIDKDGGKELIQVSWDTSDPETLEREKRALQEAEKELNISGRIITPYDYLKNYNIFF